MAPIKFEEQLKDKLEKRTLSPSPEGWAKLSQRLDAEDKKTKNPIFWWLGIAAGIIIMIAVSIQFFKTGEPEKVMPQVVEEQVDDKLLNKGDRQQYDINSMELVNESNAVENKEEELQTIKEPQVIDYKKATDKAPKSKMRLTENRNLNKKDSKLNDTNAINKELPILKDEAMMKDAVAEALKDLKSEKTSVTDKEVDSLLKLASKELFKDQIQKETIKTVDANALLMSVEDEMGQSFRSKVFEALKDSYETVKTAVAERNN